MSAGQPEDDDDDDITWGSDELPIENLDSKFRKGSFLIYYKKKNSKCVLFNGKNTFIY